MQIHEVKSNPGLKVAMNPIHLHLGSHVDNLEIAEMRFGDGFIDRLVLLDPVSEVALSILSRHVGIVRIPRRDLQRNVCGDHRRVVAIGF